MQTRTTSREITFHRPFLLGGLDGVQPPGTYTIVTEEEMLDSLTVTAWRQVSLTIIITRQGGEEHIAIDRQDLGDALARDSAAFTAPAGAAGRSRRARDLMRRGGRA
jgi:hypothetical protein